MGNRAVITDTSKKIGVYLHWNGGYDSVSAFCEYARLKGVPAPSGDHDYSWARFCQIVGNFFGGTASLGVGLYAEQDIDNGDNGVYIVGADWEIVKREYMRGAEQRNHDRAGMLEAIDNAQPEKERLGKAILNAEFVPPSALKVGDYVALESWNSHGFDIFRVLGFTPDGVPYVNRYGDKCEHPEANGNNRLWFGSVRRVIKMETLTALSDAALAEAAKAE